MTTSFTFISVIALFCYAFLFMTMVAAQKSRMINAFLLVLTAMIFWTGGSLLMRMELWPSIAFWYHVSIFGLLILGYALFNFAYAYVDCKKRIYKVFWFTIMLIIDVINWCTGFFLAPPVKEGVTFTYTVRWPVVFLFIFCTAIIAHMFSLLLGEVKKNPVSRKRLSPIIVGIVIMFIGHIAFVIPAFAGIPVDIIAGVLFALCMFYALYRRRLFKLTLLASRGSCYALSAGMSVIIFINLLDPMASFIRNHLTALADYDTLLIALTFTICTCLIYCIMKRFIDNVFVKEEIIHAENLKEFSLAASKSLRIDEILSETLTVIEKTIPVKRIYIFVIDPATNFYTIARSSSPLDKRTFCLRPDHPLVQWFRNHEDSLLMSEFRLTITYKSMWEEEKRQLEELGVECIAPLKDQDALIGLVMLSPKTKNHHYTYGDINFLSSVDSIATIAVKNSSLYERAYLEARTDELTGLLNRKYFHEELQAIYETAPGQSLSLIILNLDDFKLYNQLYGNKEGDLALQRVARIIRASVGDHGQVARYSGKEFAIILPDYDMLSAKALAESIRAQILNMNKSTTDYALKMLTVSGGVCSLPYAAATVKELIDNADMAVYHVKRHGKNAIMAYTNGSYSAEVSDSKPMPSDRSSIYSEYENTIYALTAAIDTKDHYTFSHSENVAYYATALAKACNLNSDHVEMIREAALLHDIGKIGIPEHILNKPGRLTPSEYEIMQSHVENSIGIIRHLPSLDYVIPAVIGHHERWDGRGYPRRIAGQDIPLGARVLCIADSFDAMVSKRAYKQPYPTEKALSILEEEAGRQFDPELVLIFVRLIRDGVIQPEGALAPSEHNPIAKKSKK